jgi:hypothetical protein
MQAIIFYSARLSIYSGLKLFHYTPRKSLGERKYSSYSFSTSVLDGWVVSVTPGRALPPRKGPPVPIV